MNNFNTLVFEKVIRRLITEASMPSIEGLAVHAQTGTRTGGISISLYRSTDLLNSLNAHSRAGNILSGEELKLVCSNFIVGHITIKKPEEPCAGAWEVILAAGEDYGKILYGLGYAISPSGILMSDRSTVSQKAYGGWKKQSGKRNAIELDDIAAPLKYQKTPDDPSDDCSIHGSKYSDDDDCGNRDPMPLNYAYEAQGWEKGMLKSLKEEHMFLLLQLRKFDIEREELERALASASFQFFRSRFDAEAVA